MTPSGIACCERVLGQKTVPLRPVQASVTLWLLAGWPDLAVACVVVGKISSSARDASLCLIDRLRSTARLCRRLPLSRGE